MKCARLPMGMAGLLLAAAGYAESPVWDGETLVLDEVVTLEASGPAYYREVVLLAQNDGRLRLQQAAARPLASVDEAEVLLLQGDTLHASVHASVHASGLLSIPCVALEEPAVSRSGNDFNVVLAETVMADDQVCMSLVAVTPFAVSVPLDLHGLAAGSYRVRVNDMLLVFELEHDQP